MFNARSRRKSKFAAVFASLPEGFDNWGAIVDENTGRTMAHIAARHGHLPDVFDQWGLADDKGYTVAEETLENYPEDSLMHTAAFAWLEAHKEVGWEARLETRFMEKDPNVPTPGPWSVIVEDGCSAIVTAHSEDTPYEHDVLSSENGLLNVKPIDLARMARVPEMEAEIETLRAERDALVRMALFQSEDLVIRTLTTEEVIKEATDQYAPWNLPDN